MTNLRSALYRLLKTYQFPLLLALALRLGTSLWLFAVWMVVGRYFPLSADALRETYNQLTPQPTFIGQALIDVWLRWDAVHYMNMAHSGYQAVTASDATWPPLYPTLTRILSGGNNETVFGLIISTAAAALALALFYRLVKETFQREDLARWSVALWAVFPTGFFLFAPYSDALFALLALAALTCIQQRRWVWSGILISLACLTRNQGLVLALVMLSAMALEYFQNGRKFQFGYLAGLALSAVGTAGLMIWRQVTGIGWIFDTYSTLAATRFDFPWTNFILAIQQGIQTGSILVWSEIASLILFSAITIWMAFQSDFRRQIPWLVFLAGTLLVISSKHVLIASVFQSANRYVLGLYPAYVGLAALLLRKRPIARNLWLIASLTGYIICTALYSLWMFVG